MIESQKFRNKKTGEIKTVIPILEINDWEKVDNNTNSGDDHNNYVFENELF